MPEKKCMDIANIIDGMSDEEKKFELWYLLREYHDNELKIPENSSTVDEYKEMVFKRDLNVAVNHIIEILGYELWG